MNKPFRCAVMLFVSAALAACGGGSDSNGDASGADAANDKSSDADFTLVSDLSTGTSSEPTYAYYDLDAQQVITLTESEANENTDWDVAFRRTKVYLNQDTSTPVSLYFTGNTDEFYDDAGDANVTRFINATAETEEAAFVAASIAIPSDDDFHADESTHAIDGWYSYDPSTHSVSADGQTFFIVESGDDYAKFSVSDLVQVGFGMTSITIERSVQLQSDSAFGAAVSESFISTDCTEDIYIDLISLQQVTSADAWDLSIPCADGAMSYEINVSSDNRAINDPTYTEADSVDVDAARYYPWLESIEVTYAMTTYGDKNSGYGWGDYGVNGGHGLWPNFAIYIIRTPTAYYKFQITNYYHSETQSSGTYTFRFEPLELVAGD